MSSATLYAYVSRGLLRSEGSDGQRERRYSADDVARLKRRRDVGRKAESIAANALDFGTPVLESSLTLIENGRLYYRGLRRHRSWRARPRSSESRSCCGNCDERPFDAEEPAVDVDRAAPGVARRGHARRRSIAACVLLPAAARWDHPSWVEDRSAMLETGVRILRLLTAAVTGRAALAAARPRAARRRLAACRPTARR